MQIKVSSALETICQEVKERTEAIGVYHVNPVLSEGIFEAFESFIWDILEDQDVNHRNEDVVDDLWDESIRVKQRKSHRPVSIGLMGQGQGGSRTASGNNQRQSV